MRIGINALYLIPGGVGGTEIFLRNLLLALSIADRKNQYFIFTNRETGPDLVPRSNNFREVKQNVAATNRPARIIWEQTLLPWSARKMKLDVMLNAGFTSPYFCHCPQATFIHDLQYKRHPEFFKPIDLICWKLLVGAAIQRADCLLSISEATSKDIRSYFGRPSEVAVLGVEDYFFELGKIRQTTATKPYILCVSTLHPHKNLELLLRAYASFRTTHPEYKLVLAGMRGFHAEVIENLVLNLDLIEHVRITGWIPRKEVYDLYKHAHAFVFPSLFEGFGIPLIEAMAVGIPSVCADVEPMSSNAGEAALKFQPDDEEDLATCLTVLVESESVRSRLSDAGRERAKTFRWKRTAQVTISALEKLYRSKSSS